jgi:hypothetical protein
VHGLRKQGGGERSGHSKGASSLDKFASIEFALLCRLFKIFDVYHLSSTSGLVVVIRGYCFIPGMTSFVAFFLKSLDIKRYYAPFVI